MNFFNFAGPMSMQAAGTNNNVQRARVFRATKDSWGAKPGGGNRAVFSHEIDISIMPLTTKTADGNDGFQARIEAGRSFFVDVDTDLKAEDEVELTERLGNKTRWKVDGSTDMDYSNPFSSWQPGVEIRMTKIAGKN